MGHKSTMDFFNEKLEQNFDKVVTKFMNEAMTIEAFEATEKGL